MKRTGVAVLLLLLATGCHKKHDDGTPAQVGSMPGGGVTSVSKYDGAVVDGHPSAGNDYQTIAVNADVINFPGDSVSTTICMGSADCRNARPAQDCSVTSFVSPCYRMNTDPHITLGHGTVVLVNAAQAGFQSYSIDTVVTR